MFKGFNQEFSKKLQELNQNSENFCFSFGDLELVEINGIRRKCRIISEEVSSELQKIIGKGSKPNFIDFIFSNSSTTNDYHLDEYSNFIKDDYFWNSFPTESIFKVWMKLHKDTLKYKGKNENGILTIPYGIVLTFYPNNDICSSDNYLSISQYFKKVDETKSARTSALQEIENYFKNGNIKLEDLGAEYFFLRDGCLCNGTLSPEKEKEYHKTHIEKCIWRADRINQFKDSLITLIQQKITELNKVKKPEESKTRDSEVERKQKEQEAQQAAQKEQERLKKEREAKEKKDKVEKDKQEAAEKARQAAEAKKRALQDQKNNSITKIVAELSQEPKLENSDLSPKYQDWENQINQLTEIEPVIDLESKVLVDIQARRQDKKTAQEVNQNLTQLNNPQVTPEERETALNNLTQNEGEPAYEENRDQINRAKTEQATQNPTDYIQKATDRLENKMKNNEINQEDLKQNPELKEQIEKLKNNQISDPAQIVATENQISAEINKIKVKKEIQDLTQEVNQVLKTSKKEDIAKIKQKLIEFLAKSNIYYVEQRAQVQALLTKLEKHSQKDSSQNPTADKKPLLTVLLIVGISFSVLIVFLLLYRSRKKLKLKIKSRKS